MNQDDLASSNPSRPAFLLTWKDGNPPHAFENFKTIETWRFRSHKQAKVGDEVYLLKQGRGPRGIFGRGIIIKPPYNFAEAQQYPSGLSLLHAREGNEKKQWVVDIRIDEKTDPNKSLFLTLDQLCQLHPPQGLWYSQSSGVKIPEDVANAIRNIRQWKAPTLSTQITIPDELSETSYKSWVEARRGQQKFRENLLQYWRSCSVTGCSFQEALIASHIVPWAESSDSERLDVYNGLLLTPNLDKLFDNHFISFNSFGEILISKTISSKAMHDLGLDASMSLRRTDERLFSYLQKHEKKFLEEEQTR